MNLKQGCVCIAILQQQITKKIQKTQNLFMNLYNTTNIATIVPRENFTKGMRNS